MRKGDADKSVSSFLFAQLRKILPYYPYSEF